MQSNEEKRQVFIAIALIKNNEGKILLQRRVDLQIPDADKKWEFPGGKVEIGEDPQDAVVRECVEEIGCEIKVTRMLPLVQSKVWKRIDGKEVHVLLVCYEAQWVQGEPKILDKKVSEVEWFLESEVEALDTLKGIKELLELSKL